MKAATYRTPKKTRLNDKPMPRLANLKTSETIPPRMEFRAFRKVRQILFRIIGGKESQQLLILLGLMALTAGGLAMYVADQGRRKLLRNL